MHILHLPVANLIPLTVFNHMCNSDYLAVTINDPVTAVKLIGNNVEK